MVGGGGVEGDCRGGGAVGLCRVGVWGGGGGK